VHDGGTVVCELLVAAMKFATVATFALKALALSCFVVPVSRPLYATRGLEK